MPGSSTQYRTIAYIAWTIATVLVILDQAGTTDTDLISLYALAVAGTATTTAAVKRANNAAFATVADTILRMVKEQEANKANGRAGDDTTVHLRGLPSQRTPL